MLISMETRYQRYYRRHREERKADIKARRAADPDKTKAAARARYAANTERFKDYSRRYQQRIRAEEPERALWIRARQRAAEKGLAFTIKLTDVIIPDTCPLLGIPLRRALGTRDANSPSLDRIDNTKGYEPGNVHVVSYRANSIKNDATLTEIQTLAANLARIMAR